MSSKSEQIAERLIAKLKMGLGWLTNSHQSQHVDKLISYLDVPLDELDGRAINIAYHEVRKVFDPVSYWDEYEVIDLCMELLLGRGR